MLPPDYLLNRIEDIEAMYADLHTAILVDIARHIRDTIEATGKSDLMPSTVYQIERLNASGMLREDIVSRIALVNQMGNAEIRKVFSDAAVKTRIYDDRIYKAAGLSPIPIMQSQEMLQILEAGISKTLGSIERLTGTIAINAESRFEELLNLGYNKVVSGAMSYREAISDAVDDLARDGIKAFHYASGRAISAEAAVRMNVLTGANQTAAKITEKTMAELSVSLVRTSAHLGARNKGVGFVNHEGWQGKVFHWNEMDSGLQSDLDRSIINVRGGSEAVDVEKERQKILDGTYPTRIIEGRQRKHIEGTREFNQNREKMQRLSPGSEPAILEVDAQSLVDRYKGQGTIEVKKDSLFPQETIDTSHTVGKTWVKSLQKYVNTKRIRIIYSSTGAHVIPINDYI